MYIIVKSIQPDGLVYIYCDIATTIVLLISIFFMFIVDTIKKEKNFLPVMGIYIRGTLNFAVSHTAVLTIVLMVNIPSLVLMAPSLCL